MHTEAKGAKKRRWRWHLGRRSGMCEEASVHLPRRSEAKEEAGL